MMAQLWRDRPRRPPRRARRRQRRRPDGGLGRDQHARTSPGSAPASAGTTTPGSARSAARRSSAPTATGGAPAARCAARRPSGPSRTTASSTPPATGTWSSCSCPAQVNLGNAATALAVAAEFGVRPLEAVPRLATVSSVAGRYAQVERDGRNIRLLLAKNPASWLEAFDMAETAPTLLSINARDPDGFDTSWLYDVDFSPLRGRQVLITGDRAYDLAVRLRGQRCARSGTYRPSTRRSRPAPPGRLEVIANYTRVPGHPSGVGPCQLRALCGSSGSTPTCCPPTATGATC